MVRIYVQNPRWFLRPKNTDWRYLRFILPRVQEFEPDCRFHSAGSIRIVWDANVRYARQALNHRLSRPHRQTGSYLDRNEFARSGCDAVFCHDDFPRNAENIPVIWQNSILDPEMLRARGDSEEFLAEEHAIKEEGFHRAEVVLVSTQAEQQRLGSWFPRIAAKFVGVPFFQPDVQPISSSQLAEKLHRSGPLRCLFVGHEAKRKGLERVYAAMTQLSPSLQRQIRLTVVSSHSDGPVPSPQLPDLQVIGAQNYSQVQQLFRESDVFLMPSFFESYGLAYIEAMAQGVIPMVPDWEVQRELVDNGNCGIITRGEPAHIAQSLEQLCDDRDFRTNLASQARARYAGRFAPQVVARQLHALFHQILNK